MVVCAQAPLNSIYQSYNKSGQVRPEYLPMVAIIEKKYRSHSIGDYLYIGTVISCQYDIVTGLRFRSSANNVINIASNKLINKGDDVEATAVFGLNGGSSDEASPINFNGGHLGSNHGYFGVVNATVTGHGKTVSDVGSVWRDGSGLKFYLLQVPDANTLTLISQNTATDNGWLFVSPSRKSLIYVSGASNTTNFAVGSASAVQLFLV